MRKILKKTIIHCLASAAFLSAIAPATVKAVQTDEVDTSTNAVALQKLTKQQQEIQVGKPYNLNFWNIKQKNSFYCSQLVWAAYYYTTRVNLDKTDNNIGSAWAVHPGEFVLNPLTVLIYRNK
ncbi:YiiX/YebB-like N1pC/P60 family cysteine hydrolase [Lactococcus ileimucosae]|uniref:YiiX/YebB-like N1pC/P60 family cysteine hydrolase n=1 Tax=Lactococcus ileimucosae TaxID=2941329 RepID=A0ABV4D0J8_9LACT